MKKLLTIITCILAVYKWRSLVTRKLTTNHETTKYTENHAEEEHRKLEPALIIKVVISKDSETKRGNVPLFGKEESSQGRSTLFGRVNKGLRLFAPVWKAVVVFSILLGIVAGAYTFSSHLSITPQADSHLDTSNSFIVANEGALPVKDVETFIEGKAYYIDGYERSFHDTVVVGRLDPGQKQGIGRIDLSHKGQSIRSSEFEDLPPDTVFISVVIRHRPIYLFWHKSQTFKFIGITDLKGRLRWVPTVRQFGGTPLGSDIPFINRCCPTTH